MSQTIDLHTHSTASDGSVSPKDLIIMAKDLGLRAIALTDHDTVEGIAEAKETAKNIDIEFVPGIELNTRYTSEMHIVGLFVDHQNRELNDMLSRLKENREKRNIYTVEILQDMGFDITIEDAKKFSYGNIYGRSHIAKAMVEKGYVETTNEAFSKYLGHGKKAFSMGDRSSPETVIQTISKCGGISILAHCHYLKKQGDEFLMLLKWLKGLGLDGLEGFHTEYTKEQQAEYLAAAEKLELAVSGGSDFHGSMKNMIRLGLGYGSLAVPYTLLDGLKQLITLRSTDVGFEWG